MKLQDNKLSVVPKHTDVKVCRKTFKGILNIKNKMPIGDVARESGIQQQIVEGSVGIPAVSFQKSKANMSKV